MTSRPQDDHRGLQFVRALSTVAILLAIVAAFDSQSAGVLAQACVGNAPPNRPTAVSAARGSDGKVLVGWTVSGGCAATRFYLEASRGTGEIIEHTVTEGSEHTALLTLGAGTQVPWRISVRGFNPGGLSAGRSTVLTEVAPEPVPNPCPSGTLPSPFLTGVQASGRTLSVQWQPDSRCSVAITSFVIAGSHTPDGPVIGTVTVPYPNARSWTGEVPPGSYYVKVFTQYYNSLSTPSTSMLVHVP